MNMTRIAAHHIIAQRRNTRRKIFATIAGVVFATSMMYVVAAHALQFAMPECPTEDSTWCYWDGANHGSGDGASIIALWGEVYFVLD